MDDGDRRDPGGRLAGAGRHLPGRRPVLGAHARGGVDHVAGRAGLRHRPARRRDASTSASSPVYLVLAAGVAARFLTGDLFNLFVAFEMMLTASYVLHHPRRPGRAGARGHDLRGDQPARLDPVPRRRWPDLRGHRHGQHGRPLRCAWPSSRAGVQVRLRRCCCSSCSASRPALFPLFFWLPDSYPTAPSPVTAVFAGLLTKVGVYAIIRTQTLLFPDAQPATLLLRRSPASPWSSACSARSPRTT